MAVFTAPKKEGSANVAAAADDADVDAVAVTEGSFNAEYCTERIPDRSDITRQTPVQGNTVDDVDDDVADDDDDDDDVEEKPSPSASLELAASAPAPAAALAVAVDTPKPNTSSPPSDTATQGSITASFTTLEGKEDGATSAGCTASTKLEHARNTWGTGLGEGAGGKVT